MILSTVNHSYGRSGKTFTVVVDPILTVYICSLDCYPVQTHQNRLIQTLIRSEYLSDPQNFNLYYTVLLIITIKYKEYFLYYEIVY